MTIAPVALTSVIMKCFARLFKDHITSTLPVTLDSLQFTYCSNRSTDDAIAIALHIALSHLGKRNIYVRMLFIDYSSAFNNILPSKLIIKLGGPGSELRPVQLGPGLPDGPPPGGEGRKRHLHFAEPPTQSSSLQMTQQ